MPYTLVDNAEFENEMHEMSDRQLSEFTARQMLALHTRCKFEEDRIDTTEKKITALEQRDQKTFGIVGGLGTTIGAAIVWIIEYFTKRPEVG